MAVLGDVGEQLGDAEVDDPLDGGVGALRAALSLRGEYPDLPIMVLSQIIEQSSAADLLQLGGGIGYLLKDRVSRISEFTDAVARIAAGETVIDPEVVRGLLARQTRQSPLERLTGREKDVLSHMAEGRSNSAVAKSMHMSEAGVVKHVGSIFTKLGLQQTPDDHRRVLAVVAYLQAPQPG